MTIIQALEAADLVEKGSPVPEAFLELACVTLAKAYRDETLGRLPKDRQLTARTFPRRLT